MIFFFFLSLSTWFILIPLMHYFHLDFFGIRFWFADADKKRKWFCRCMWVNKKKMTLTMLKVRGLVWAIRTPAGHLISAWWEQITRYISSCLNHENHRRDSFATNLFNSNFMWKLKREKEKKTRPLDIHALLIFLLTIFLCCFLLFLLCRGRTEPWMQAL